MTFEVCFLVWSKKIEHYDYQGSSGLGLGLSQLN